MRADPWSQCRGLIRKAPCACTCVVLTFAFLLALAGFCVSQESSDELRLEAVSFSVRQELRTRELLDYSDELAGALDEADGQAAFTALNVFLRTGQLERISAAISHLPVDSIIPLDAHDIAKRLLELEYYPQLRTWLDRFPYSVGGFHYQSFEPFFLEWESLQGKTQLEDWLASKASLKSSFGRKEAPWPSPWSGIYYTYLSRHGKLRPHLDATAEMIRQNPADREAPLNYLAIWSRLPGEKPALDWLGQTVAPKYALDAFVLARTLGDSQYKQRDAAARLLERSLALPGSEYDRNNINLMGLTSMYVPAEAVERFLQQWAKTELAEIYLKLGESQRAQKYIEELTCKADGTLADLAPFRLAGQTQAMSGQRVVERRIEEAKPERKDSEAYWVARADYYVGRGELAEAEDAYRKALALAPDSSCLREYGLLLTNQGRHAEAEQLFRAAYLRSPTQDFWLVQLLTLAGKPGATFDWDDPLNWDYFAHSKQKGRFDQRSQMLLERMRARAAKKDQGARFWEKLEELAGQHPPAELAYQIAVFHDREGRPDKAIEFMTRAWNNWSDDYYPYRYNFGEELVRWHITHDDWRGGERALRSASRVRYSWEPNEWDHWAQLALLAAQEGEHQEAVRLWRERCRLTLHPDENLMRLASQGVRGQLRACYTGLKNQAPDSRAVEKALEILVGK